MATWNDKCTTCRKSGHLGYGICSACNEPECNYEPQLTYTTTSTTYDGKIRTMYSTTNEIKE